MKPAPVWLRGIISRPVSFVLVVLLSATACATAALGPMLVNSLQQATLSDAVEQAGTTGTQLTVFLRLVPGQPFDPAEAAVLGPYRSVDQAPGPTGESLWRSPATSIISFSNLSWQTGSRSEDSRVVGVADRCDGVVLVTGRCPTGTGETMVSASDLNRLQAKLGEELPTSIIDKRTSTLRVVGSYDAASTMPGVLLRRDTSDAAEAKITADPLIVTRGQLAALGLQTTVAATLRLGHGIELAQVSAAQRTLDSVKAAAAAGSPGRVLFFDSQLATVLYTSQRQSYQGAVLVGVGIAQALAIAFFALGVVLQRTGRARAGEWGLGRLRGIPGWRWLMSITTEPALALVAGLPLGWVLAVLVARSTTRIAIGDAGPIHPWRWPVLAAAVAALLGGLLALAWVAVRAMRRPPVELLQDSSDSRRRGILGLMARTALVLAAGLACYQLMIAGSLVVGRSRLGLVAPALAALSVGMLAVSLGVVVAGRLTTRSPRTRVGLVVGRQLVRAPSALNPTIVVAAAVALTVFATQTSVLAQRNQQLLADATIGAPTVLQVAKPATLDLIEAVRRADPSGRQAMAVQEKASSADGGTSRVVAVDSARFDAITTWSHSWGQDGFDTASLAAPAEPVYLTGKSVSVSLSDAEVKASRSSGSSDDASPSLSMTVETPLGNWFDVYVGPVAPGSSRLQAPIRERPQDKIVPFEPNPCLPRCRLVAFTLATYGSGFSASFTVSDVSTDRQSSSASHSWLGEAGWHQRLGDQESPIPSQGTLSLTPGSSGLRVQASDPDGTSPFRLVPGDTTDLVPAVIAPRTTPAPFPGRAGAVLGTGLDGQVQQLRILDRASTLPRSLDDGVLVDLRNAEGSSPRLDSEATSEVWLAADAPVTMEKALTDQGLRIVSRQTLGEVQADIAREPTARGAALSVTIGWTVLALAVLTLLAARLADATLRRASWLALRQGGVSRRALRLFALVEVGAPALLAVAIGLVSGACIFRLAAPRLPLRDSEAPGPPLDLHLDPGGLILVATVAAAAALVAAVAATLVETRRSREEP